MEIQKVSIIGLGALGVMFGKRLMDNGADVKFIASEQRIERYRRDGVFSNGERCDFAYASTNETGETDDLIMFAVKYNDMKQAICDVKHRVGPHTILLSMLNGITSERDIAKVYGWDNVICAVAQGMDALKVKNKLRYTNMGLLSIGNCERGPISEKVHTVARFFKRTNLPYEVVDDMSKRMWGKWMVNVGVNQTIGVYGGTFLDIQREGAAREAMLGAMREVIALAKVADINVTEADLPYWLNILGKLDPTGKPSLRQDIEAKRKTEVEMFAGAVVELGEKYGVPTPVNRELYTRIKEMEAAF